MVFNSIHARKPGSRNAYSLALSQNERRTLRNLAGEVADLASHPGEAEKRALWFRHNALKRTRPLVLAFPEDGWIELIPEDTLACENALARDWELKLRKEIFWARHIRDDRVVLATFDIPHCHEESEWGLAARRIGGEGRTAYTWDAPLKSYDALHLLRYPEISVDYEQTGRHRELADTLFGDLLDVRVKNEFIWTVGLTLAFVNLRGLEQMMFDFLDEPDRVHELMAFLRDGHMAKLDFLEEQGLLRLNNDGSYVGSGGFGWSNELPGQDLEETVLCRHLWGYAESQETVGISPQMFGEFVFPYQLPLLERFGLNCYGCCEPLDDRWQYVQQIPRLRRVSVSPWSDRRNMAEYLEDDYILSLKPHPAALAFNYFDEENVRLELRRDLRATRDCHVEIIMKDTMTFADDPTRPGRWVQIAREEIESL